jgi:hypothetical protein
MIATVASAIFARRDSNTDGRDGRIDTRRSFFHSLDFGSTYRSGARFLPVREDVRVTDNPVEQRPDPRLEQAVVDIEEHVRASGWDVAPMLFALVRADRFVRDDPVTAKRLGLDQVAPDVLAPVEQDELPDEPLDEVLGSIEWPEAVAGCVLTQEIVVMPPSVEDEFAELPDDEIADRAAEHPERREGRLVVGVLRGGASSVVLRLRGGRDADDAAEDDLLTGPDLAPNLIEALLATLT